MAASLAAVAQVRGGSARSRARELRVEPLPPEFTGQGAQPEVVVHRAVTSRRIAPTPQVKSFHSMALRRRVWSPVAVIR